MGLDQLAPSFSDLSVDDVLGLADRAIQLAQDSNLKAFNTPLPLIGKSVNQLLQFVDPLLAALEKVKDQFTGDLRALRDGAQKMFDAIKGVLGDPSDPNAPGLSKLLTPAQNERLVNALDDLDLAVQHLPNQVGNALALDATAKERFAALVSAAAEVKQVIAAITPADPAVLDAFQMALDQLKQAVHDFTDQVPSAQGLAVFLFKALGLQVPDFSSAGALTTSVLHDLDAAIADLKAAGVPDDKLAGLVGARDLLHSALQPADLVGLARSYLQLQTVIAGFAAPDTTLTTAQLDGLKSILNEFTQAFPRRLLLNFDPSTRQLTASLDVSILQVTKSADLNFSLSDQILGVIPVEFQTAGKLDVQLGGVLHLGLGLDLSPTPAEGRLYLLPGTPVDLTARIIAKDATAISATASIGGINAVTLGGVNAVFTLEDGNDATPASLQVVLADPDGKIGLAELADKTPLAAHGQLHLDIPIQILGNSVGDLTADLADVSDLSKFTITLPADFAEKLAGGVLDPAILFRQIPAFLDLLRTKLEGDILARLPLVGSLSNATGNVLESLNDTFVKPLVDKLSAGLASKAQDYVENALKKLIFDTLGPGLDPSDPDSGTFHVAPGKGLGILATTTGDDLVTSVDQVDSVHVETPNGGDLGSDPGARIVIRLHLKGHENLVNAGFDTHLKALGLHAEGGIQVGVDFDVESGFTIDKPHGFALLLNDGSQGDKPDLVDPASLSPDSAADPEFEFRVTVGLMPGTSLNAALGFLSVSVADRPDFGGTGFTTDVSVDLKTDHPDGSVPLSEIPSLAGQAVLNSPTFDAKANLGLVVGIKGSNGQPDKNFPSLETALHVDWKFGLDHSDPPTVEFDDLTLDLGGFISRTLKPILQQVQEFLKTVEPILDALNANIPVISQLLQLVGQDPVTFLDGIALFGSGYEGVVKFRHVLTAADQFIKSIASVPGDIRIDLGTFDFSGQDFRNDPSSIDVGDQNQLDDLGAIPDSQFKKPRSDPDEPDEPADPTDTSVIKNFLKSITSLGDNGLGIDFPFLTHPSNLIKLLLGQDVTLVTWHLPDFRARFEYSQIFGPIIPPFPIFAKIGGAFELFTDFTVGLDTRGLRDHKFLDGFFFADRALVNGEPTGADIPELGMSMEFTAGAELNIAFAEAGVEGGIRAEIDANWNDPNGDGKVYLDELKANLSRGIDCVFDLHGALTAFLRAYLKIEIPLGFTSITIVDTNFTLVDVTLLDFSHSCPPLPPPQPGTQVGDTLFLNIGDRAPLRQPGATDGDETVTIRGEGDFNHDGKLTPTQDLNGDGEISEDELGEDLDNNGQADPSTVAVTGFGVTQIFSGVHHIVGNAGGGDDSVTLDPSVTIPTSLTGGPGDDELQGGSGDDTIRGGEGDDQIVGGAGNDSLFGDAGNDQIFGNAGADTIEGGAGDDTLYGGNNDRKDAGDLADQIAGGDGNDKIYGNLGDDVLAGDAGSDTIHGGRGADRIDGGTDDDILYGEEDNDTIFGGAGQDQLFGGDGDDRMVGGDGNDSLMGQAGDDILAGDNATVAPAGSVAPQDGAGNDTLIGGDGNDSLYGQGGNDVLTGDNAVVDPSTRSVQLDVAPEPATGRIAPALSTPGHNNDYLEGNAGSDLMYGQGGNDKMIGGSSLPPVVDGADTMLGGEGDDILVGDNGTINIATGETHTTGEGLGAGDQLTGGPGDDVLFGGDGADVLTGDGFNGKGNDVIVGDQGDITASMIVARGTGGNDTLVGSAGRDTLLGGAGNDLIAGDDDPDVVVGDNGQLSLLNGAITRIETTDPANGGDDVITGGRGPDTLLGGAANDLLSGGDDGGADIILGDNGVVVGSDSSTDANDIFSTYPTFGGRDTVHGGRGDDTIVGGSGGADLNSGPGDSLFGDEGNDILVGDNARITRDASNVVQVIATIFPDQGGNDTVQGNDGNDTVLGGFGGDDLHGNANDDVLVGDNGLLSYVVDANPSTLDLITTTDPTLGASDTIHGDDGSDTRARRKSEIRNPNRRPTVLASDFGFSSFGFSPEQPADPGALRHHAVQRRRHARRDSGFAVQPLGRPRPDHHPVRQNDGQPRQQFRE